MRKPVFFNSAWVKKDKIATFISPRFFPREAWISINKNVVNIRKLSMPLLLCISSKYLYTY